jgi:hypothetical protein
MLGTWRVRHAQNFAWTAHRWSICVSTVDRQYLYKLTWIRFTVWGLANTVWEAYYLQVVCIRGSADDYIHGVQRRGFGQYDLRWPCYRDYNNGRPTARLQVSPCATSSLSVWLWSCLIISWQKKVVLLMIITMFPLRVSYRDGVMENEPKPCAAVKGTQVMVGLQLCM